MRKRRRWTKRTWETTHAKDLMQKVLHRRGVHGELRAHRLLSHWPLIVGEKIAGRSCPDGLSTGTLWVRVDSSAWMHQLSFLRNEIATRANEVVGHPPLVTDVRIHLGQRRNIADDDILAPLFDIRRRERQERALPSPASGDNLRRIEDEVGHVEDSELRQILLDARRRLNM